SAVATVEVQSASQSGVFATVTAVGFGTGSIRITDDVNTTEQVNVPVSVAPDFLKWNGVFRGEVKTAPAFAFFIKPADACAGSLSGYTEAAVVNLNSAGVGTVTAQDSPGFDRQYPATVSPTASFTSQATVVFLGSQVPGKLAVTFTGETTMSYQEATTYQIGPNSTCTNVYAGTLTKQ